MWSRWKAVPRLGGTLLIAFGLYLLIGLFFGLVTSPFIHGIPPGWLIALDVAVCVPLALLGALMIRGYLPGLRDAVSDWNSRSTDWAVDHPVIAVGSSGVVLGSIWYSGMHQLGAAITSGVISGGGFWFNLRRQRRRRGPAPT
jgi:hypothetical protein